MPFPELISTTLFICERLLQETDGVTSAIRIVDVFNVPPLRPDAPKGTLPLVQAWGHAILKFDRGFSGEHYVEPKLLNTKGEMSSLGEPLRFEPQEVQGAELVPDAPVGVGFSIQLNIGVKNFGTCYLCIYLDGEEVARTPFTLRLQQPSDAEAGKK